MWRFIINFVKQKEYNPQNSTYKLIWLFSTARL